MSAARTELQKEVVEALVSSNAVNLEAIGSVFAKYGARAALTGSEFGVLIGRHAWDICIPAVFRVSELDLGRLDAQQREARG